MLLAAICLTFPLSLAVFVTTIIIFIIIIFILSETGFHCATQAVLEFIT